MTIDKILTPEERAEYHALMERACIDPGTGRPRPTRELGEAVMADLRSAEQAGRSWATMMLDSAAEAGLATRAKRWLKTKFVVPVTEGDVIATRAAIYSVRKQGGSGETFHQPTLMRDLSRGELSELMEMDRAQIASARLNLRTHQRLLDLLDAWPTADTVGEALDLAGLTLDGYLGQAAA